MAVEDWLWDFDSDEWPRESECDRCGRPIWWSKSGAKWIPMSGTGDGRPHFEVCPAQRAKASEFEA